MSMPYPQQPAGQPAAPYAPGQPVYQGVPQGYSTAPQGFAPGYAPVPQGPVTRKVNWVSIILGVVGPCGWPCELARPILTRVAKT